MKYNRNLLYLTTLLVITSLTACNKGDVPDPDTGNETEASAITKKVNSFIFAAMDYYYLWYDQMPDINYNYETDSKEYFYKLLYDDEDKWSFITDDIDALLNSFEGIEKTYGWSLAFGAFYDENRIPTGNYFAVVEYVYPKSPAASAGIKRGDIIKLINGGSITADNYTGLLSGENLTFTLGALHENGIADSSDVTLTALELNLNPVLKTAIVEYGGKRIGYMFYAQYIDGYNIALDTAFQSLSSKGIDELVIDLRYNPGGKVTAAAHLCSSVAPVTFVNNEDIVVTYQWNNKRQAEYENSPLAYYTRENFDKNVPVKMNLENIYFLTGNGTASASELTITALAPYMNVTTIGDTTYGKYTASMTLTPSESYADYDEIKNWGLQPIILRYANKDGETDFKDGLAPSIVVKEDLLNAYPLGDINDPLFKAAIEEISGSPILAKKSAVITHPDYRIFDRGFSRYDINKREMLIDSERFNLKK